MLEYLQLLWRQQSECFHFEIYYHICGYRYVMITMTMLMISIITIIITSDRRTQSKIHGGFVTFYPIHFGHLKCGTHWGYPKYCYSKPGQKDYTIKLKRNGVVRLPNYLHIEENMVLHFLRLPPRRLPCLPLLQG